MVQEILKNIDQKRDQEIGRINQEKEQALLILRDETKKQIVLKKQEALLVLNDEKSKRVSEFLQAKNTEIGFVLQSEKNKIIQEVWDQVEEEINKMPRAEFEKIIKFLIGSIPKNLEGEIQSSKRAVGILKKSLKKIKVKDGLKEEGFFVKTKNLDLDFRISEVLKQMKENLNPEIIKILFWEYA